MLTRPNVIDWARAPCTSSEIEARFGSATFWHEFESEFSLRPSNEPVRGGLTAMPRPTWDASCPTEGDRNRLDQMKREGYCVLHEILPHAAVAPVLQLIRALVTNGWLPAFVFLFDDAWTLFDQPAVSHLCDELLGSGHTRIPYFYAWHVAPGGRGYRPHRECGRTGFTDPDGAPRATTVWIPLTDATTDNGCMSVVPRDLEIHELPREQLEAEYGPAELQKLASAALLHRARALPARAGSVLTWNHEILHWGGWAARHSRDERISVACEYQRSPTRDFVHPHSLVEGADGARRRVLLRPGAPFPEFHERVYLLARSIVAFQAERRLAAPFVDAAQAYLARERVPDFT